MAAYTTLVNLPHFLSSFTSLETGTLVLFLAAVFTVQLVLLQNYSRRRRRLVQPAASGVQCVPSAAVFCLDGAVHRHTGSADISDFEEITHLIPTYMVQGKEKRAGGGSGPALLALERI